MKIIAVKALFLDFYIGIYLYNDILIIIAFYITDIFTFLIQFFGQD